MNFIYIPYILSREMAGGDFHYIIFHYDKLVWSTHGLDPTNKKVVRSGPKVRVEIDASVVNE